MPEAAPARRWVRHAPAGQSIAWAVAAGRPTQSRQPWPGLDQRYFGSGTAALAAAIEEALDRLPAAGSPRRVILPAYGCPNLLAAALKAQGEPEFVDLAPGTFAPEPQDLLCRLRKGDCVVVSVDPFGSTSLDDDFLEALEEPLRQRLVHDLAQSFAPFDPQWRAVARSTIVSFGRAKPASLTMFGLLLSVPEERDGERQRESMRDDVSVALQIKLLLRSLAYNVSLRPAVFGALSRLPFLGIGTTTFEPLGDVTQFSAGLGRYAAAAAAQVDLHWERLGAATQRMLQIALDAGAEVPAAVQAAAGSGRPLWRIPVLHDSGAAAERFSKCAAHLGVSRLYGRTMAEFAGIDAAQAQRRWPVAWRLSRTLTTLPSHGRLRDREQRQLGVWLKPGLGRRDTDIDE